MMQSFILMAVIRCCGRCSATVWLSDGKQFHRRPAHIFPARSGRAPDPDYAATIPLQTFMVYQLMFAIITPALITGAFAERMKFSAMVLFMVLWSLIVYARWRTWCGAKAGC